MRLFFPLPFVVTFSSPHNCVVSSCWGGELNSVLRSILGHLFSELLENRASQVLLVLETDGAVTQTVLFCYSCFLSWSRPLSLMTTGPHAMLECLTLCSFLSRFRRPLKGAWRMSFLTPEGERLLLLSKLGSYIKAPSNCMENKMILLGG